MDKTSKEILKKAQKTAKSKSRFYIIKNFFKTIKYFFKTILYNICLNFVFVHFFFTFISVRYRVFLLTHISNSMYNILYYGIILLLFLPIKYIVYGNVVANMNRDISNDFNELYHLVLDRYFKVMFAIIFYILSSLLVISVPLFILSPFFIAVGDLNDYDKTNMTYRALFGYSACKRSAGLLINNLFRFIILTSIIVYGVYYINNYFIKFIYETHIIRSYANITVIRFIISDIIIIYGALIFSKFLIMEKVFEDEKQLQLLEEKSKLNLSIDSDKLRSGGGKRR